MKKIISLTFSFAIAIAMLAVAPFAYAAYSINTAAGDCRTVNIANHNTQAGVGSPCWTGVSVSASDDQSINVAIFYHNSGNSTANNVVLTLTDPTNITFSGNESFTFTGNIYVNGTLVKSEKVIVNLHLDDDAEFVFEGARKFDRRTLANNPISNGTNLFSSGGLSIGNLGTGIENQGVVTAKFTLYNDDGPVTNDDEPYVDTENPDMHDDDTEVTLNGWFDANGSDTEVYFRYREEDESSWDYTDRQDFDSNDSGDFSERLDDLDEGDYEYQACAENDEGTRCGRFTSSQSDSGYMEEFTIEDEDNDCPRGYEWDHGVCVQEPQPCPSGYTRSGNSCVPIVNAQIPTVTTLRAIYVGSTAVTVDGYFNSSGCNSAPSTFFLYGTTQNLGNQTPAVTRTTNSGPMATVISGLAPSTTYYYRAAATNCAGTGYGSIETLTTGGAGKANPGPVVAVSGGGSFIKLMITNNRDTVRQGREIAYDLAWENISNKDLKDLVLEVNFPTQMSIVETERGEIARSGDSVVVNIPSLDRREKGEMTIYTEIHGGLRDGDPVVAQAIMAFENPTTQATENAIAYDADEFLGGDEGGFLSLSFLEWLVIIIIILIIIALIRYITRKDKKEDHPPHVPPSHAHNHDHGHTPAAGASQDYIVYRPTPKQ